MLTVPLYGEIAVLDLFYTNIKLVIYWDPNALLEAQGEQQIFAVFA